VQEVERNVEKLKEEKATLERMVESRSKLIMEITNETGLDHMGEDDEDEDDDNEGNVAAPPAPVPPAAALEEIIVKEDHVENGPHELDDLDDLTKVDYNVDEWFSEDGSNDRD
jgi:hypothetical protein